MMMVPSPVLKMVPPKKDMVCFFESFPPNPSWGDPGHRGILPGNRGTAMACPVIDQLGPEGWKFCSCSSWKTRSCGRCTCLAKKKYQPFCRKIQMVMCGYRCKYQNPKNHPMIPMCFLYFFQLESCLVYYICTKKIRIYYILGLQNVLLLRRR